MSESVFRTEPLANLLEVAAAASASLLWIVDARATTLEDTLDCLLPHASDPAASLPVDEAGAPLDALIGRVPNGDVGSILAAIPDHRMPLRYTSLSSLLVPREQVLEQAPPNPARFGVYAGFEWTRRLFARHPGFLVPSSRVRLAPGPHAGSPLHVLRMARAGVWGRPQAAREIYRGLTERARA